jgi:hypothetical protein
MLEQQISKCLGGNNVMKERIDAHMRLSEIYPEILETCQTLNDLVDISYYVYGSAPWFNLIYTIAPYYLDTNPDAVEFFYTNIDIQIFYKKDNIFDLVLKNVKSIFKKTGLKLIKVDNAKAEPMIGKKYRLIERAVGTKLGEFKDTILVNFTFTKIPEEADLLTYIYLFTHEVNGIRMLNEYGLLLYHFLMEYKYVSRSEDKKYPVDLLRYTKYRTLITPTILTENLQQLRRMLSSLRDIGFLFEDNDVSKNLSKFIRMVLLEEYEPNIITTIEQTIIMPKFRPMINLMVSLLETFLDRDIKIYNSTKKPKDKIKAKVVVVGGDAIARFIETSLNDIDIKVILSPLTGTSNKMFPPEVVKFIAEYIPKYLSAFIVYIKNYIIGNDVQYNIRLREHDHSKGVDINYYLFAVDVRYYFTLDLPIVGERMYHHTMDVFDVSCVWQSYTYPVVHKYGYCSSSGDRSNIGIPIADASYLLKEMDQRYKSPDSVRLRNEVRKIEKDWQRYNILKGRPEMKNDVSNVVHCEAKRGLESLLNGEGELQNLTAEYYYLYRSLQQQMTKTGKTVVPFDTVERLDRDIQLLKDREVVEYLKNNDMLGIYLNESNPASFKDRIGTHALNILQRIHVQLLHDYTYSTSTSGYYILKQIQNLLYSYYMYGNINEEEYSYLNYILEIVLANVYTPFEKLKNRKRPYHSIEEDEETYPVPKRTKN